MENNEGYQTEWRVIKISDELKLKIEEMMPLPMTNSYHSTITPQDSIQMFPERGWVGLLQIPNEYKIRRRFQ